MARESPVWLEDNSMEKLDSSPCLETLVKKDGGGHSMKQYMISELNQLRFHFQWADLSLNNQEGLRLNWSLHGSTFLYNSQIWNSMISILRKC